jgi:hypothetical protein
LKAESRNLIAAVLVAFSLMGCGGPDSARLNPDESGLRATPSAARYSEIDPVSAPRSHPDSESGFRPASAGLNNWVAVYSWTVRSDSIRLGMTFVVDSSRDLVHWTNQGVMVLTNGSGPPWLKEQPFSITMSNQPSTFCAYRLGWHY